MSRQTKTQLSVFALLGIGVVIGFALALWVGSPEPSALAVEAKPAPQNDDAPLEVLNRRYRRQRRSRIGTPTTPIPKIWRLPKCA